MRVPPPPPPNGRSGGSPVGMTTAFEWLAALAIAFTLACSLQACQMYRECRNHYQFERAFCVRLVLR